MNTGVHVVVGHDRIALEITLESDSARRDLGPVAWSVLETLALAGQDLEGRWVATSNARGLARRLGIGKDRAAAALNALRRAGLIDPRTSRDTATARFAASSYEVMLPVSRNSDAAGEGAERRPPSATRTRGRRQDRRDNATLDLFSSLP